MTSACVRGWGVYVHTPRSAEQLSTQNATETRGANASARPPARAIWAGGGGGSERRPPYNGAAPLPGRNAWKRSADGKGEGGTALIRWIQVGVQ